MRFLIIFLALTGVALAQAPDLGPPDPPDVVLDDAASVPRSALPDAIVVVVATPVAAASVPALADPDQAATSGDVLKAGAAAVGAVKAALIRPALLTVVFCISAVLWAILAVIKAYGARWLSGRAIRLITLVAAPVLTFASAYGAGMPWFDAVILAGGGPGALLLNELGKGLQPPKG